MKRGNLLSKLTLLLIGFIVFSCADDSEDIVSIDSDFDAIVTQDLILDWNNVWLQLDQNAYGMRPTATARSLAYIHLAAYETAVFDMDGYTSTSQMLDGLEVDNALRSNEVHLSLALNACYARVMDHFMYTLSQDEKSSIVNLAQLKENVLTDGVSEEVVQASKSWGLYVAEQIIAYSETDQAALDQIYEPQPLSYEPAVADGYWTYSDDAERALFPYWGYVRTFVISAEETSTVPPMIYDNGVGSEYYNQMMEVYEINNEAREQDNENLWIAEFWSDDVEGLMMSPPGRQFSIAGQLATQYELEYEESLALFVKLGFALNDAAVSAWADKYEHMVMRPSVFIHEYIDPDYVTNLYTFINWPNPSFPGYPSGHSAFASTAAGLFINAFGDSTDFTDRTHQDRSEFRGMPRQYTSFTQMAEENGFSRIPLGVHIRMDCEEGLRLGYEVANAVNDFELVQ